MYTDKGGYVFDVQNVCGAVQYIASIWLFIRIASYFAKDPTAPSLSKLHACNIVWSLYSRFLLMPKKEKIHIIWTIIYCANQPQGMPVTIFYLQGCRCNGPLKRSVISHIFYTRGMRGFGLVRCRTVYMQHVWCVFLAWGHVTGNPQFRLLYKNRASGMATQRRRNILPTFGFKDKAGSKKNLGIMNVLNLSSGRRCLLNLTKCRHPARFSSTHLSHEVVTDRNLFVEVSKTTFLSTQLFCLGILSNFIWDFYIFNQDFCWKSKVPTSCWFCFEERFDM